MFVALGADSFSQDRIAIPELGSDYPRMVKGAECRREVGALLETESGQKAMSGLVARVYPFVLRHEKEPEWIVSRLQMYWDSHATDIYVKGEELDHVSGRAPVPTVRFSASRGGKTNFRRPVLADVSPYQDSLGLLMHNRTLPGEPLEWVDPRKTGRNVESINLEIMSLARDAAFLYWWSGDKAYARFASDIFDMYMTGMYYRNIPVDMNHGHQQTLVGMTSFEVIHEDIAVPAAECYDFLHDYLEEEYPDKIRIYEEAFRKWADCIIAGGVPHNNWNLIQAQFVLRIALVLGDNQDYLDGRGREWYLNEILNESSIRQWSPDKLIGYGFDGTTGLWKECPGYAMMVVSEWTSFIRLIDEVLGVDMAALYPVLSEAVAALPQYLFPNGLICGWGDTYYGNIDVTPFHRMIANAQEYGKDSEEKLFTSMYKCLVSGDQEKDAVSVQMAPKVSSFTSMRPLKLTDNAPAGEIDDFVSPVFWSEGVSWFAARNGMDKDSSLMFSVCGSMGNHMHANGISMELYGKGFVMGSDSGRGSGYSSLDYSEYYSQFPAHNTVCVDGISSYPVMQSHHPLNLEGSYPEPQQSWDFYSGIMLGDFSFLEPETSADQRRQLMIIGTSPGNGYYIDVFRSRRRDGKDKMHDYFYHNIGEELTLSVPTEPTEELAFAGAHLSAYSYLWDKFSCRTSEDVEAEFAFEDEDGARTGMHVWMKGEEGRTVFRAKSPGIDALSRTPMPYDVASSPCMTFVARQEGEAWSKPFVAVYEPFSDKDPEGKGISSVSYFDCPDNVVGICVGKGDGTTDVVISSDRMQNASYGELECNATIALFGCSQVFMYRGKYITDGEIAVSSDNPGTVSVFSEGGKWYYSSDTECRIRIGRKKFRLPPSQVREIR